MCVMHTTPSALTGANIRAELARQGKSQTSLAAHLGITPSQVSKRLRGDIPLTVDHLAAAADFLDLPVATLIPFDAWHTERVSA